MPANADNSNAERAGNHPSNPQETRKDSESVAGRSKTPITHAQIRKMILLGRTELCWKQEVFAENVGLSTKTIQNVESGRTQDPETLRHICDVLEKELAEKGHPRLEELLIYSTSQPASGSKTSEDTTPLELRLAQFGKIEERNRLLNGFSPEFCGHPENELRLVDYFRLNEDSCVSGKGEGQHFGVSYRELKALWSDPKIYRIYEASLLKYMQTGGKILRTFAIGEEFFDPALQLVVMRTGMRQTMLGFEPLVVNCQKLSVLRESLRIDCDMIAIANFCVADFVRMKPVPCVARTTKKKFIDKAWRAYREMSKGASPFQQWLKQLSFAHRLKPMMKEIEKECSLIREFAGF